MRNQNKAMNRSGFALVAVIISLLLVGILIPALIYTLQRDSKDTQMSVKRGQAFNLAEMGQDRGVWKLRESEAIWDSIQAATPVTGYNDDIEHKGSSGGHYKIKFSSGPGSNQVTILSKGKYGDDVRAIQATYTRGSSTDSASGSTPLGNALTVVGQLQKMEENFTVHWGPIKVYKHINVDDHTGDDHVEGSTMKYFPRKYAVGKINGRDETDDSNNGAMPGNNWSTYDYVAFYTELGTPPAIDLDALREEAKNSEVPVLRRAGSSVAAAHDTSNGYDSGYYTHHVQIKEVGHDSVKFDCSTCVIFVEGKIDEFPSSSYLRLKALVATGNVTYMGRRTPLTGVKVPEHADLEYQHSSLGNYFSSTWTAGGTTDLKNIGLHGFLYVGGNLKEGNDHGSDHDEYHTSDHYDGDENSGSDSAADGRIYGSVYVAGNSQIDNLYIYYDEDVDKAMAGITSETQINRATWDEVTASW